MIQSYNDLINGIQELFGIKKDYNEFLLTDPDCCQVCRREGGGYLFAEAQNTHRDPYVCVYALWLDPKYYSQEDLLNFGKAFYSDPDLFVSLPECVQMETIFETIGFYDTDPRFFEPQQAYDWFLELLNSEPRKENAA